MYIYMLAAIAIYYLWQMKILKIQNGLLPRQGMSVLLI